MCTQSLDSIEITLERGLCTRELEARLAAASRTTDIGRRALAFYLDDMEERRAFEVFGFRSAVHFAVARLGLSRREARDLVATGRKLRELERIDSAFSEGKIGWTKTRLLARVASPEHEEAWLETARTLTCQELEREVAISKEGAAPRRNRRGIPQTKVRVVASVDPITYEMWERGKKIYGGELGPLSDDDMVRLFARMALETGSGARSGEAGSAPASKVFAAITVNQCPTCHTATLRTEDGPVELDEETLERYICEAKKECGCCGEDGEELTWVGPNGEIVKAPPTPRWLREKVILRDGGRCRFCGIDCGLNVHHIVFRSKGGKTEEENLLTACLRCHGAIHAGFMRVEGVAPYAIVIRDRFGRIVSGKQEIAGAMGMRVRVMPEERAVGAVAGSADASAPTDSVSPKSGACAPAVPKLPAFITFENLPC